MSKFDPLAYADEDDDDDDEEEEEEGEEDEAEEGAKASTSEASTSQSLTKKVDLGAYFNKVDALKKADYERVDQKEEEQRKRKLADDQAAEEARREELLEEAKAKEAEHAAKRQTLEEQPRLWGGLLPMEREGKYTGKSQKERDRIFRQGEHKKRQTGQADRNNFVEAEKRLLRQALDPKANVLGN